MKNIYGLGTDIIEIKRLKKAFKKNKKFKNRIFTYKEIKSCASKKNGYSCFAKRFAAKEAFLKALGIGISSGINFNEIEVHNNKNGKPNLKISGKTLEVTKKIIKNKKFRTFLSLSDEKLYSIATVILLTQGKK